MCSYKTAPVSTTADPEVVVCIVDRDPQENGLAITFGTNFLDGNVLCRFCSFLDSVFTTYVVDFFLAQGLSLATTWSENREEARVS